MYSNIWNFCKQKYELPEYRERYEVRAVLPILWLEHCVECAMPLCYVTCPLYEARKDKQCLRFKDGIQPITFRKRHLKGAMVSFKRWAKLEAMLPDKLYGVNCDKVARLEAWFNTIAGWAEKLAFSSSWSWHRPSRVIEQLYNRFLMSHVFPMQDSLDGFLAVIYNHEVVDKKVHIEMAALGGRVFFHESLSLSSGWNEFYFSLSDIKLCAGQRSLVRLYFDNQDSGTLTFKYLDFVSINEASTCSTSSVHASKVKCVAWDLDETLWHGIIGDAGSHGVCVRRESVEMVKRFDEMGIIQTVVSKNNYDIAWKKIEEIGLDKYFLCPAINWGRKSRNLVAIAKELNINIDTFAVIDDSLFERMEISNTLPQVRVFDVKELEALINRPEFDIPITVESRKRRESYRIDSIRKNILTSWSGDYDEFLRTCILEMHVFRPSSDKEIDRCLELLQRSNQYNVSRLRRDKIYLETILSSERYQVYCYEVHDKYGNYGIVGFASFESEGPDIYLRDFVMSCRVAQKKVERAFLNHVVEGMATSSCMHITVEKTDRNMPLRDELCGMGFELMEDNNDVLRLRYKKGDMPLANDEIVCVVRGDGNKCIDVITNELQR